MLFEQCDDMEIQAYLKWQGTNNTCVTINGILRTMLVTECGIDCQVYACVSICHLCVVL